MTPQALSYSPDNDKKIYCSTSLVFHDKTIRVSACTIAGTKDGVTERLNEDSFAVALIHDTLYAAVFDGSSSQKQFLDLEGITGARFASHFLKQEFEKIDESVKTTDILRSLNKTLLERNLQLQGADLHDANSLPSTTATLVGIDVSRNVMHLSHVGDTFCMVLYKDGHTSYVTEDRNKPYDDGTLQYMKTIADERHITPREARNDRRVQEKVSSMLEETHNKPDGTGQGIINGSPDVEQYIQDKEISLDDIQAILLGSDGFIPPGWYETKEDDQKKFFATIQEGGLQKLIEIKQTTENNDQDWNFLRFKHSDDATAVYIGL